MTLDYVITVLHRTPTTAQDQPNTNRFTTAKLAGVQLGVAEGLEKDRVVAPGIGCLLLLLATNFTIKFLQTLRKGASPFKGNTAAKQGYCESWDLRYS